MLCVSMNMIYRASVEHQRWMLMTIKMAIIGSLPVLFKAGILALRKPGFLQRSPGWLVIPSSSWSLEALEYWASYLKGTSGLCSHIILWLFRLGISSLLSVDVSQMLLPETGDMHAKVVEIHGWSQTSELVFEDVISCQDYDTQPSHSLYCPETYEKVV